MNDRICMRCKEVFCSGSVTLLEGQELFRKHLKEKHSGMQAKVKNEAVAAPVVGKPEGNRKAQRIAARQAQIEARRREFFSATPNAHSDGERSESTFVPDVDWEVSAQGNIAFHQSPRKVGSDGVPIYERTLFGKGVLDTLLEHPELMRKARGPVSASIRLTERIQRPKSPTPEPVRVHPQTESTQ
jgi:hypothetical protein